MDNLKKPSNILTIIFFTSIMGLIYFISTGGFAYKPSEEAKPIGNLEFMVTQDFNLDDYFKSKEFKKLTVDEYFKTTKSYMSEDLLNEVIEDGDSFESILYRCRNCEIFYYIEGELEAEYIFENDLLLSASIKEKATKSDYEHFINSIPTYKSLKSNTLYQSDNNYISTYFVNSENIADFSLHISNDQNIHHMRESNQKISNRFDVLFNGLDNRHFLLDVMGNEGYSVNFIKDKTIISYMNNKKMFEKGYLKNSSTKIKLGIENVRSSLFKEMSLYLFGIIIIFVFTKMFVKKDV